MSVHIYTADLQPATDFVDRCGSIIMRFHTEPRSLLRTDCCRKWRWAKYVRVQVYYDGLKWWCADGHGCKTGKEK